VTLASPSRPVADQRTAAGGCKPAPDANHIGRKLRVLVAEDNRINQQLAGLLLRKAGHEVEIVDNGDAAVAAVASGSFDIVLMDVQMPLLDGIEATNRIRALPPPRNAIPIIALTAHAMAGAREEYLTSGMDGYLSKPLDPVALLRVLAAGVPDMPTDPEPPVSDEVDLDLACLAGLERYLPPARVAELMTLAISQIDEFVRRINDCAAAADLMALGREAHSLAGAVGNIGATRLYGLSRQLEAACTRGEEPTAADLAPLVTDAAEVATRAVNDWLTAHTAIDQISTAAD
jgi:two-component system sensor histidine kinase/response regulator